MSFLHRPCAATASSCVLFLVMLPTTVTRIGKSLTLAFFLIQEVRSFEFSAHTEEDDY